MSAARVGRRTRAGPRPMPFAEHVLRDSGLGREVEHYAPLLKHLLHFCRTLLSQLSLARPFEYR
jgi:hypothetical protein